MASHNFNFAGGDILSKIGATWFVSYTYFERNKIGLSASETKAMARELLANW